MAWEHIHCSAALTKLIAEASWICWTKAEALQPSSVQIYDCTLTIKYKSSLSLSLSVLSTSGPLSSILVNKYGSRPVMIAGGCLSGIGLIGASFCNSVQALYFCIGVVGGTYFFPLCIILLKKQSPICFKECQLVFFNNIKTETHLIFPVFFFFLQV